MRKEFYGQPTVAELANKKIYVEIKPIDDWNSWQYVIYFEDAMSPFYEVYRNGQRKHFQHYQAALNDAIDWLKFNEHIEVIELPF